MALPLHEGTGEMQSAWDQGVVTDVKRQTSSLSSLIKMPLPAPEDDIDIDAPTLRILPVIPRLAVASGPVQTVAFVPEPLAPRWAMIAVGVLATVAFALGAALALS